MGISVIVRFVPIAVMSSVYRLKGVPYCFWVSTLTEFHRSAAALPWMWMYIDSLASCIGSGWELKTVFIPSGCCPRLLFGSFFGVVATSLARLDDVGIGRVYVLVDGARIGFDLGSGAFVLESIVHRRSVVCRAAFWWRLKPAFATSWFACGDCWAGDATGCRLTLVLALGWPTCSALRLVRWSCRWAPEIERACVCNIDRTLV